MTCACCGGAVPKDAKCCPHCGAVEYRGLRVLSPSRPSIWIGSISGFVFGVMTDDGDLPSHLLKGIVFAVVGSLVCGFLAWISFPGRKPMTCSQCGGMVAPDAGRCPHCETRKFASTSDSGPFLDRDLMALGAFCGTVFGFIYGVTTASAGFLSHAQNAVVFAIGGAYVGAALGLFQLLLIL